MSDHADERNEDDYELVYERSYPHVLCCAACKERAVEWDSLVAECAREKERADRYAEALRTRIEAGHNDTCQSVLETVEKYPCNCGHDLARAALAEDSR